MRTLGIETTCDETGAAVVEDGRKVLSNVVASSVDLQKKYGGVVPEVAAREQVRVIIPVIVEAIAGAAQIRAPKSEIRYNLSNPQITKWAKQNIDAIAVAHGPGLIGSLLIGVETAKALAIAWNKPLVPVNHLVGHIYSNWLKPVVNGKSKIVNGKENKSINHSPLTIFFPLVALIVSGGHTDLVLMSNHGRYKLLGSTLDDAAGEAFDKVARVLGLGYPGGPEVERLASSVLRSAFSIKLPRPMIRSKDFNFSFSGLKTAVVNRVNSYSSSEVAMRGQSRSSINSSRQARTITSNVKSEIAREFQRAVVDVLVAKTIRAAQKFGAKTIVVGGGVAANSELRSRMSDVGHDNKMTVIFPSKEMSVDNGAMIAAAAFYKLSSLRERSELNFKKVDPLKLSANPSLHF